MKKVVFIVEGQTEQIFILNFLMQLCTIKAISIDLYKFHNKLIKITSRGVSNDIATNLIQIINVENDERVFSYIQDNLESFKRKGFVAVFGLRDRYSGDSQKKAVNPDAIDRLASRLSKEFDLEIQITVAIEEIETWFLAVPDFLLKYDPRLTLDTISNCVGFNISDIDLESIAHPSTLLNKLLGTVGLKYRKRLDDSHKIADAIDYETLYLEKSESINSLGKLVKQLNFALA